MNIIHHLSWSFGIGLSSKGGSLESPTWDDISMCLKNVKLESGSVTLVCNNSDSKEERVLQILVDGKKYILTLLEIDLSIRAYIEDNTRHELVEFQGNLFNSALIFTNFSHVLISFRQFYEIGDVSRALLQ